MKSRFENPIAVVGRKIDDAKRARELRKFAKAIKKSCDEFEAEMEKRRADRERQERIERNSYIPCKKLIW